MVGCMYGPNSKMVQLVCQYLFISTWLEANQRQRALHNDAENNDGIQNAAAIVAVGVYLKLETNLYITGSQSTRSAWIR
jgi:hypothetical protein